MHVNCTLSIKFNKNKLIGFLVKLYIKPLLLYIEK